MQRVAVVGPGGAGKTTFARTLGALLDLPVGHLDGAHWRPGWVETPRDEWRTVVEGLVAAPTWIIEGNYGGTFDERFARADTVIVVQPSRLRCVARIVRRVVANWHRAIQAPGCPEHFDASFMRWVWRYPRESRPGLDQALDRHRASLEIVELRSARAVARYLDAMRATAGTKPTTP